MSSNNKKPSKRSRPKEPHSNKTTPSFNKSMNGPVLSLLGRGNDVVLNSGHIGYDTAGDWAISREVGGMATDGRVGQATDILHQFTIENAPHKPSPQEMSVSQYIESLSHKGNALDIVAALDRNAHENIRRNRLTISELLKEARKEQRIQEHSSDGMVSGGGGGVHRQKLTRDSSSNTFDRAADSVSGFDIFEETMPYNDTHIDNDTINTKEEGKEYKEEDRWADKVEQQSRGNNINDKGGFIPGSMLSTYPPPHLSKNKSEGGNIQPNQTVSSFPKLPELNAVSPRTRRRLDRLPKPSPAEMEKMAKIDLMIQSANLTLPPKLKIRTTGSANIQLEENKLDVQENVVSSTNNVDPLSSSRLNSETRLNTTTTTTSGGGDNNISSRPTSSAQEKEQKVTNKNDVGTNVAGEEGVEKDVQISAIRSSSPSSPRSPSPEPKTISLYDTILETAKGKKKSKQAQHLASPQSPKSPKSPMTRATSPHHKLSKLASERLSTPPTPLSPNPRSSSPSTPGGDDKGRSLDTAQLQQHKKQQLKFADPPDSSGFSNHKTNRNLKGNEVKGGEGSRITKEALAKSKSSRLARPFMKTPPNAAELMKKQDLNISFKGSGGHVNHRDHVEEVVDEIEKLRSLLGMEKLIPSPRHASHHNDGDEHVLDKNDRDRDDGGDQVKDKHGRSRSDRDSKQARQGSRHSPTHSPSQSRNNSRPSSPHALGSNKQSYHRSSKKETFGPIVQHGRSNSLTFENGGDQSMSGLAAATDDIPIEVIRKSKAGQEMLKKRATQILNHMIGNVESGGYVFKLLQSRFETWKEIDRNYKVFLEARKLRNVTRYAYKWIAFTEIKVRRRLLAESRIRYLKHMAAVRSQRNSAALLIQCKFRGHTSWLFVKEVQRQRNASVMLQCTYRIHTAKQDLKKRKRDFALKVKCVIRVQTKVRAIQARHKVHTLLLIKKANELLAAKRSRTEEARKEFAIVGAAIKLQRAYRTSNYWAIARAYVEVKKKERNEKTRNWIRRWKARVLLRRLQRNDIEAKAKRIQAATLIQSYARRWKAEAQLAQLADEKEVRRRVNVLWKQHIFGDGEDPNKPVYVFRRTPLRLRRKDDPPEIVYGIKDYPVLAATATVKGVSKAASALSSTLASNITAYDSLLGSINMLSLSIKRKKQEEAAQVINRYYRGHKARRRCRWMHLMKRANDRLILFQKKTNLALKLQSRYRGNVERKRLAQMKVKGKIITLQVMIRTKLAKRLMSQLRMLKGAATQIQSCWRRFKCSRDYNDFLLTNITRIPHAIVVQAHGRRLIATRKVICLRYAKRVEAERISAAMKSINALHGRCTRNLLVEASYSKEALKYRYESKFKMNNLNKKQQSNLRKMAYKGAVQEMFSHWCVFVRPPGTDDHLTDTKFMKMLYEADLIDDKVLKRSDCDLIFAAQKEAGSKTINFTQFITAMDVIAVELFGDMSEYPAFGHKKSRLRGRKARHAKLFLEHLLQTKTNMQFYRSLMKHTDNVLAAACRPVQGLARRRGASSYLSNLRAAAAALQFEIQMNKAATTIQSKLFRKFKGRCEGLRLARGFIVKMLDPSLPDDPFWWSRVTGRSSWTKPWVFGKTYDATKEVHLPPKGSEYSVLCVHCSVEKATIACQDCGEAFCKQDFDTLHMKGHRREHRTVAIPTCFRCGFQTASRFCETCRRVGMEREREGEAGAYGEECGNYCDHCFGASHPKLMAQDPTKSINKRLRDVEYTLEKLKLKRQMMRRQQRERRRKEYARLKELGLLKDSDIIPTEDEFDFDNYNEDNEDGHSTVADESVDPYSVVKKPGSASQAKRAVKPKKPLNKAEEELNRQAMMTPEALAMAEREKEANALLEALKEEKRSLAARKKEEDRLQDEKLLPFKSLRKEVLSEVESNFRVGAEGDPPPRHKMTSDIINSKVHRPNWLVVPCVECKGLAARWRCEQCNDIFCRPCFDFIHARGVKQTHNPVVALSWYTPYMNKKFEELCLVNARRKDLQSMAAAAARRRDVTRNAAAVTIQKRYRGVLSRRVGIPATKKLRLAVREAWRERRRDREFRESYLYRGLDYIGLAPKLPSDTLQERALLRIPAWKRANALAVLKRNAEEAVHFSDRPDVCPPKDPKKKKFVGLEVPNISEADLAMQAKRTAKRLPGTASIEFGSRYLFVTHPLMGERPLSEEDGDDNESGLNSSQKDKGKGSKPKTPKSGQVKEKGSVASSKTSSTSSSRPNSRGSSRPKFKTVLGDEPFVNKSDILYLFYEKREYYSPEDEVLQNEHYKLTCTANPVVVRRIGTMQDYEKEVKLHKAVRKAEKDKQALLKERLKEAEEVANGGGLGDGISGGGLGDGGLDINGDEVKIGSIVTLDGLTDSSSSHLNGSTGRVIGFDAVKKTYIVSIIDSDEQIHAEAPSLIQSPALQDVSTTSISNGQPLSATSVITSNQDLVSAGERDTLKKENDNEEGGDDNFEGENNDGENMSQRKRDKQKRQEEETSKLANRGKYVIELKFPWMKKSVYNVPILNMVPANNAMKRLPWMGWEFRWLMLTGPVGQFVVQSRVDILDMVVNRYRNKMIPKLEENPTSQTNQTLIRLLNWRIDQKEKYASNLKLLLKRPRKAKKMKKELSRKATELNSLVSGTSMADVQAAKDKRKESAYMDADDKGPAWVEQLDPSSGGTFWQNSVTGEISLEDPSNRAKSLAEMSNEERKHMLAKDKFKAQKEKEKQAAKKKGGHGRKR